MWGFVAFVLFVIAAFLIFRSARGVERQREEEEKGRKTEELVKKSEDWDKKAREFLSKGDC